jgi:hypothetical protein
MGLCHAVGSLDSILLAVSRLHNLPLLSSRLVLAVRD